MNNKKRCVQAFYNCGITIALVFNNHSMCLVWFGFVWFFLPEVVWQECSNFEGEKFVFYGFEFLNKLIFFFTWDALVGMFKGNLLDGFEF